ncbi:MAG TPA: Ig-like domain-containing protein [Gemmatimonadales bacterium]|nr:Ig-like domain-containing protein [Gemmatimonadales bacterium]
MTFGYPQIRALLAVGLAAAALGACKDDSTGSTGGVSKIVISPASDSILVGGSTTLVADAQDASGHSFPGAQITWSTSNDAIATVDQSGHVHGDSLGVADIRASVNDQVNGFATIYVVSSLGGGGGGGGGKNQSVTHK